MSFTEEQIERAKKKNIPESMYRGKEWQKEQQNMKKYNSMPYDIRNRLDGLSDEGFSGKSLDDFYDLKDSIDED